MGAPSQRKAPAPQKRPESKNRTSEGGRYMVDGNKHSPFEEVHLVGEDGFAVAEESDDDAEADGSFRGSVGDDEKGEYLPGNVAKVTREGDEVDVDGVEDQLDGHEHDDDVAARDDADGADQE